MLKHKSFYLIGPIIVTFSLVFLLSACTDSREKTKADSDPYHFYDQVELEQTKDVIDTALGVTPEEKNGTSIYIDPDSGFGVQVSYDAADMVSIKTLYHSDQSKISVLSGADVTPEKGAAITEGMSYEEVKNILGSEGIEIVEVANPTDPNSPIVMMIWFNPNSTGYYIPFVGHKGTVSDVNYFD